MITIEIECKWCGTLFKKHHNRQVYCSKTCADQAKALQDTHHKLRWWYKNKDRIYQTRIGTNTISGHRQKDPLKEQQVIENELIRLGLRKKRRKPLNSLVK